MTHNRKVIRSICVFARAPSWETIDHLDEIAGTLSASGFLVQTRRLCSPDVEAVFRLDAEDDRDTHFSVGSLHAAEAARLLERFCGANSVAFNVDVTDDVLNIGHVELLQRIIRQNAAKTFSFTYVCNNALSSPFYPSAAYERDGFALGLQAPNLSGGCQTLEEWLLALRDVWLELDRLLKPDGRYLGIDTSVAPLGRGEGSFVSIVERWLGMNFSEAVTTDVFTRMSRFIRQENPRPVGLCGLMFPCLEDFELADKYQVGDFSVERCLFLALQSGLGVDAYPIGVDESPERVLAVLRLVKALSEKHSKPLSARFISDGLARVGERAEFGSPYLADVTIRPL